jgi:threonine dehydrogenase-like Zn-dependent dehydrogenase
MPPPRQVCCQDYTLVPARKLARLPDGVTFEDAAMLAGVGDALNAWDALAPGKDESIVVVGVGAMGWGAIATVKALQGRVIAVGGTGRRADLARLAGAGEVVPLTRHDEDVSEQVLALVPGGADCVIETSATDWGVRQSFAVAAAGARIALTGGGGLPASAWELVAKELAVFGMRASHHQEPALQLIADGRIDLKPTITHRMSLERVPDAFALLTGPDAKNAGRVMIEIGEP